MGFKLFTRKLPNGVVQTTMVDGDETIGSVFSDIEGDTAHNFGLQVNRGRRGNGLGKKLLKKHEDELRELGVKCVESELPETHEREGARRFHRSRGTEIDDDGKMRRRL